MRKSNNTFTVLDLLESQHAEVDMLIERIERGRGDRRALFEELADKLAAHSTIEEKLFYPAVMQANTKEQLFESVEEHLSVKRLLADMLELDPDEDEDEFDAKLSLIKEQVNHHAHEEEEAELFPKVRRMLSEDELAGLGNEALAMFEMLMTQQPRMMVPEQTDEAAPLPSPDMM